MVVRARLVVICAAMAGVIGLLVARVVLEICHLSRANVVLGAIDTAGGSVSLGTAGLFTFGSHANLTAAVNIGVAVTIWLAIGSAVTWSTNASAWAGLTAERGPRRAHRTNVGARRRAPRVSRVLFLAVTVLGALETTALTATYLLYSRHYVSTENANVDGDKIAINAPATGAVMDWAIDEGSDVQAHQIVGRIQPVGGSERPERTVRAPSNGTVAVNDVVNGSFVTAGTELATAYDQLAA